MTLLTEQTPLALWQDTIKIAEKRCSIILNEDLESYLTSLLMRYANRPDLAHKVFAMTFLEAQQARALERRMSLQLVGDECLLYAGLFPRAAEKRHVKINYFVDLGRGAYAAISRTNNDLYDSLAVQFVNLMDVLQSIQPNQDLMPLEAYDQWNLVGSQRALKTLQKYTNAGVIPIKVIDI